MSTAKRKVGGVIITHPGQNNYGTALQGFATVKILSQLGYSLRIIEYNKTRSKLELLRLLPSYIKSGILSARLNDLRTKWMKKTHPDYSVKVSHRTAKCDAFKTKYFTPITDYYTGWNNLCNGSKNYDVIFVGSDQVWGPWSLYAGFYNLMFVDKSVPQFSYASSFGRSTIMEHQKKGVATFLNKMDAIGVRETSGAKIVHELTGRKAEVVVDPTLLLHRNDWEEYIKESTANYNEPYILCYMLGERMDNRNAVTKLGKELNMQIVSFNNMDWYNPSDEGFGDINNYDADAIDFVKLVKNASYVVTDSFHCSVFSIIFHKNFLTFYRVVPSNRLSTHGRIDSLLGLMGLEKQIVSSVDGSIDLKSAICNNIEWDKVELKLNKLRESSMSFLKSSLEIKK